MASVSVRKTANGKAWRVMWRDRNRKQCQRTFDMKRDADAYAGQLRVELTTGAYIDPRLARTTVGEQYVYWQTHRSASRGRQHLEASVATQHLVPRWGKTALEDVTFDETQAWVNELSARYSAAHVRSCFRLLSNVLQSAVRSRKLPVNPVEGVKIPTQPRKVLTWDDVLTPPEIAAVAEQADARWQAFIFCTAWLGWRLSEGLGVRRCDVNLLRGEITLARVVIEEVNGRCEVRKGGKSEAAIRTVPLPPTVAKVLEAHLHDHVHNPDPEAFLFVQENGNPPSRSNLLRRVLYPALARGGCMPPASVHARKDGCQVRWYTSEGRAISRVFTGEAEAKAFAAAHGGRRDVNFLQLRHTAASLMIDQGLSPLDVSQRMGHARPSITMDVYSHLFQSKRQEGTEALEAAIVWQAAK